MKSLRPLSDISEELRQRVSGRSSALLIDTGGLVDIAFASRLENLGKSHCAKSVGAFLDELRKVTCPLITPKVYREIDHQGRIMINKHVRKLPKEAVESALEIMLGTNLLLSDLNLAVKRDDARYDAYWTSKVCCNGDEKKSEEGFSEADSELITHLAYLYRADVSGCTLHDFPGSMLNSVGVLSSDSHVLEGANFLSREFGTNYSGVFSLSTRGSG